MVKHKRSLWVGAFGAALMSAGYAAQAQEGGGNDVIGPPQLKDFRLPRGDRLGRQPAPIDVNALPAPAPTQRPVILTPPPPRPETPARMTPAPRNGSPPPAAVRPRPAPIRTPEPGPASDRPPEPSLGPARETPAAPTPPPAASDPAPLPATVPADPPVPLPSEAKGQSGPSYWYYALPVALLALFGIAAFRRRRRGAAEPAVETVAAPAPPAKPRPDPMPRPWLELSLKAERATFTDTEAVVLFELEIANKGKSAARNLRLDVKMINAGAEQDKEIGTFFKTAGRESTKLKLPAVEAGVTGVIQGSVRMPREEMRAMRLDERLLFIPVVAVNALYDWGDNRVGQTSRSYIVGRELQEQSEKMGAFRVDQGPRIWRAVGQRPHKLAKRV